MLDKPEMNKKYLKPLLIIFQVAASSNAKYTPILDGLKKLPGNENNFEVDIGSIILNDLIPAGATDHLHYKVQSLKSK